MEYYNEWTGEEPREIVLTLVKEPEEVVLTYEAELPGQRKSSPRPHVPASPPAPAEKPGKKKKKRRWPWVLLILVGALLLVGLGIAAAVAQEHRGTLKAESGREGTRFVFTMPLKK